eukprot:TRINITY_DN10002_c0_g1_i1.p1 TRINITY_DN10002_c0_g1~~TRINITY_DN10002_c0_g1_i1.p1  ORF type:complete len:189 (+),score=14.31 TRINITY_DN10002_c0_g1_i1:73-567(+)
MSTDEEGSENPPPPFPGSSPETMDSLRQEIAVLRQKANGLEAENTELTSMVRDWRRWYANTYRPQMEFLDAEVSKLVVMAPKGRKIALPPAPPGASTPTYMPAHETPTHSAMASTTGSWGRLAPPPGMRMHRQASAPGIGRSPKKGGFSPTSSPTVTRGALPPL